MLVSILIIGFSIVLVVYWFRYSCILLFRNSREAVAAASVANADPRFTFSQVRLHLENNQEMDPLQRSLDRDFQLLKYLVEHAAGLRFESIEDRLLMIDYKVMQWWYRFARIVAPQQARAALIEMSTVLAILVSHMCERAGVTAET